MSYDNINLDELFDKAKKAEPALKLDDVEFILDNDTPLPETNYFSKFFTGDFKMIMIIGAAITAIGVIFLNTFNFNENYENYNNADRYISISGDKTNPKEELNTIIPHPSGEQYAVDYREKYKGTESATTQEIKTDSDSSSMKIQSKDKVIKGINSIKLLPEEILQLGIKVDESGRYIEVLMSKNQPRFRKIYVDGGIEFDNEQAIVKDADKYIIPSMITDNRGLRRVEIHSAEDTEISIEKTIVDSIGNNTTKIRMAQNIDSVINLNGKIVEEININSMRFEIRDSNSKQINTDNIKVSSISVDLDKNHKELKKKFGIGVNDSIFSKRILIDKRAKNPDGSIIDSKNIQISFNDSLSEPINFSLLEHDINKLLPIEIMLPNSKDRNGKHLKDFAFIIWLNLDEETYSKLPKRVQMAVKPEYEALNKTGGAVCGYSPNENGKNYLDVWRTCDGVLENLNASPNPTDGYISLSFKLRESRNISITINDVFGNKIQDVVKNKRFNEGDNFESFNINAVESGMYLIVVTTDTGEQALHRVILNR